MELHGVGDGEDLGGGWGVETVIKIYGMKKIYFQFIRKCSICLILRVIQVKTTLRFLGTQFKMDIKKKQLTTNAREVCDVWNSQS